MNRCMYAFFSVLVFTSILCASPPTSLIRNNLLMSAGTMINDAQSPLLPLGVPESVPYTAFLDFLTQQSIGIENGGTLNIVLQSGRAFKTGPWQGTAFTGDTKNYYPGVRGLPSSIANGDSNPQDGVKNAYSHLQIGKSALGSSMWFLLDKDIVRIDAYRNLSQLLEPANPIPLGINLFRPPSSGFAGDVKIGTGFQAPNLSSLPPVIVKHISRTASQVGFGGKPITLTGAGAHVQGNLNITGQIFGKIGALVAFNRYNLGVLMEDQSGTDYDYEFPGSTDYESLPGKEHSLTLPLRLNSAFTLSKNGYVQTGHVNDNNDPTGYITTRWPYSNNLGWDSDSYDFENTTGATLRGFMLVQVACQLDPRSRDLVHLRTLIQKVSTNEMVGSPWTIYEFGGQSNYKEFVSLTDCSLEAGQKYRFYFQIMKWTSRIGGNNPDTNDRYSSYPLTVLSTNCMLYVLPASIENK